MHPHAMSMLVSWTCISRNRCIPDGLCSTRTNSLRHHTAFYGSYSRHLIKFRWRKRKWHRHSITPDLLVSLQHAA